MSMTLQREAIICLNMLSNLKTVTTLDWQFRLKFESNSIFTAASIKRLMLISLESKRMKQGTAQGTCVHFIVTVKRHSRDPSTWSGQNSRTFSGIFQVSGAFQGLGIRNNRVTSFLSNTKIPTALQQFLHLTHSDVPLSSAEVPIPGIFKGGEEQARELNLLEDWGREW